MPRKRPTLQQVHDTGIPGMKQWLGRFKPTTMIGNPGDSGSCPLQRYYSTRTGVSVCCSFGSIFSRTEARETVSFGDEQGNATWEVVFQKKAISHLGRRTGGKVTAGQCLEILEELETIYGGAEG